MKYDRFEQLPVWQAAMTLAEKVYVLSDHRAFGHVRELKDQIRRAALSVSNNIAEGFERGTTAELLSFLYIARGSAGEVRSILLFCQRLTALASEISNFKSEIFLLFPHIHLRLHHPFFRIGVVSSDHQHSVILQKDCQ